MVGVFPAGVEARPEGGQGELQCALSGSLMGPVPRSSRWQGTPAWLIHLVFCKYCFEHLPALRVDELG